MHSQLRSMRKLASKLLQKKNAHKHDFTGVKKAIKASLKNLRDMIQAGHTHDTAALREAKATADSRSQKHEVDAKTKILGFKHKACPTMRAKLDANKKWDEAKKAVKGVLDQNVPMEGVTYADMDLAKDNPALGSKLRELWRAQKVKYTAAKAKATSAQGVHEKADQKHAAAMAVFKSAVTQQAEFVNKACNEAISDYSQLKKEVDSNVRTRRALAIAIEVVECHITNLTDNVKAATCAKEKKNADTKKWLITEPEPSACKPKNDLIVTFGPISWVPTKENCAAHHWHAGACDDAVCPAGQMKRVGLGDLSTLRSPEKCCYPKKCVSILAQFSGPNRARSGGRHYWTEGYGFTHHSATCQTHCKGLGSTFFRWAMAFRKGRPNYYECVCSKNWTLEKLAANQEHLNPSTAKPCNPQTRPSTQVAEAKTESKQLPGCVQSIHWDKSCLAYYKCPTAIGNLNNIAGRAMKFSGNGVKLDSMEGRKIDTYQKCLDACKTAGSPYFNYHRAPNNVECRCSKPGVTIQHILKLDKHLDFSKPCDPRKNNQWCLAPVDWTPSCGI